MYKILAAAFILVLSTCHPVHAEKITGSDAMKIWKDGEVQAREGVTKALILIVSGPGALRHNSFSLLF